MITNSLSHFIDKFRTPNAYTSLLFDTNFYGRADKMASDLLDANVLHKVENQNDLVIVTQEFCESGKQYDCFVKAWASTARNGVMIFALPIINNRSVYKGVRFDPMFIDLVSKHCGIDKLSEKVAPFDWHYDMLEHYSAFRKVPGSKLISESDFNALLHEFTDIEIAKG